MFRGIAGIHGSAPIQTRYRAWSPGQQWCPEGSKCRPDDPVTDLYGLAPVLKLKMKSRKAKPGLQDLFSLCDLLSIVGGRFGIFSEHCHERGCPILAWFARVGILGGNLGLLS